MSNIAEFDRIMKDFYRAKTEEAQRETRMLWDANLALINAIANLSDAAEMPDAVKNARQTGLEQAEILRGWLERR